MQCPPDRTKLTPDENGSPNSPLILLAYHSSFENPTLSHSSTAVQLHLK
jgi:hypothetical protein